jgi:hypothetical protein
MAVLPGIENETAKRTFEISWEGHHETSLLGLEHGYIGRTGLIDVNV